MAVFEARVIDLASDGRAVVKHPNGQTVFVPGMWLNELGRIKLIENKGRVGVGVLETLLEASPERIDGPCPYHGVSSQHCGGCPWQFVSYEAQLNAKQMRTENVFTRIGVNCIADIFPSPNIFQYRNRAQLKTDGKKIGFVAPKSSVLVPVEQCLVMSEKNQQTLADLVAALPNQAWRPRSKKHWTTLDIDDETDLHAVSVNKRLPFKQANDQQNQKIKAWLGGKFQSIPDGVSVVELFCGSGNLTEVIAQHNCEKILAVEAVSDALTQLKAAQLANVEVMEQNVFLEDAFEKIYQRLPKPDVLVLDPPRDGLKNKVGMFRKKHRYSHIFYISCDLMTLARDIKDMQEHKYKVVEVQPLDQFPHTPHVECMVHLQKA